MRDTASLSEVIQPDADPLTPSAQLVALPTATTAAVVPGVASNLLAAFNMTTTSDNDAAPTPNHSLIASLLPTIRPPAALLEPDGHTKRTTAQAVIGKVIAAQTLLSFSKFCPGSNTHRHTVSRMRRSAARTASNCCSSTFLLLLRDRWGSTQSEELLLPKAPKTRTA